MMWAEYERLAKVSVSWGVYHYIVEPMYLAIPEQMSKEQFVELLNNKQLEKMSGEDHVNDIFAEYSKTEER